MVSSATVLGGLLLAGPADAALQHYLGAVDSGVSTFLQHEANLSYSEIVAV
jgi:hypothetical protein